MCVAVDIRRCDESMPSPSAVHQITSSPSKVRSGNSANVAMVAAMTLSLPITTEAGERTTISFA